MQFLVKLLPNRVRRNYRGGAGIDWLHGASAQPDGERPEEWVGSTVPARNPGLPAIENEGYAKGWLGDTEAFVKDLVAGDARFWFGRADADQKTTDPGFLLKILDSAMRLHVQAHPTREFARKYLASPYGKLECYYILRVRAGVDPYIRLGFQHPPTPSEWKRIIERQDIAAMDSCFEKIPVQEGDIWYVPGGMPHAIGEGILMLEIMEPSDLVVRCEFEREGVMVPPAARFMGRDLDFCLNVFDYKSYSRGEITARCKLRPVTLQRGPNYILESLVDTDLTAGFRVRRLRLHNGAAKLAINNFTTAIVTRGTAAVTKAEETIRLNQGESFLIAAGAERVVVKVSGAGPVEICLVESVL